MKPATNPVSDKIVDVVMPKMGESLQEGTILKWLKAVGDKVERDEMILEISTDKVDTEVPSPVGGSVFELLAKEQETVEVGSVIARIATVEVKQTSIPKEIAKPAIVTSEVTKSVIENKPVNESKTESVKFTPDTFEIPRESDGQFYSPLVRSIAKDENISLAELKTIKGTGVDGRLTKNNLMNYLLIRNNSSSTQVKSTETMTQTVSQPTQESQSTIKTPVQAPVAHVTPSITLGSRDEVIPMDRMRQLISDHMTYSKHTSAHVTSVAEADVTGLVRYRENNKNTFEKKEGYKLTYTPFFTKAIIDGVTQYPMVNVSVDGKNIIIHHNINLGVATALEDGNLIVPVIKNANSLNISGLSRAVFDVSSRARAKKLNPDDIQGGTITLTNVGTFGTLFGTPIINQPQCAIIGVGAIKKRAVVKELDGEDVIVVRNMMYISITYDHRVIDGMLAGKTLAAIVKSIENMSENTISL